MKELNKNFFRKYFIFSEIFINFVLSIRGNSTSMNFT